MSGAELLEQVRRIPEDYDDLSLDQLLPRFIVERIAALNGCVLLTAEEREQVRRALIRVHGDDHYVQTQAALTLLA